MRAHWRSHLGRLTTGILPATAITLLVGGVFLPGSAQAQFFGGWDGGWGSGWGSMGPGQIYESIAQRGFRVYGPLRHNGSVYIADVIDRRGRHERLILAAADGEILQRFILDDPRLPSAPSRNAYAQPQDDGGQSVERADRGDLVPPASIPDAGAGYGGRDNTAVEPVRPQGPRARQIRPRVVDRTPDQPDAMRRDAIPSRNLMRPKTKEPLRIRSESATAKRPSEPPVTSASRPSDTPEKPSVPAPTAAPQPTTTTRLTDPLAIPGGEPKTERHPAEASKASAAATGTPSAPRVVPGNVTGSPEPAPAASAPPAPAPAVAAPPAKSDVPVAPLD